MNAELERMWKEEIVAYFMVLLRHSPRLNEENDETFNDDSRHTSRDEMDVP
jgi:hypothetical protein